MQFIVLKQSGSIRNIKIEKPTKSFHVLACRIVKYVTTRSCFTTVAKMAGKVAKRTFRTFAPARSLRRPINFSSFHFWLATRFEIGWVLRVASSRSFAWKFNKHEGSQKSIKYSSAWRSFLKLKSEIRHQVTTWYSHLQKFWSKNLVVKCWLTAE